MTITKRANHKHWLWYSVALVAAYTQAADVELSPFASGGFTYTDNVNRVAEGRQGSLISDLSAGISTDIQGAGGSIDLDYELNQLFYSHDSTDNETYQTLAFTADKGIKRTGFRVDAAASIENIARADDQNANADIFSGDTIENKDASLGVSYRSNPRSKVDLTARAFTDIVNNEDDIGNYNGYGAEFSLANGASVKKLFWQIDGSYQYKESKDNDDDTAITLFSQELGLQTLSGWVPLIRFNYEDYEGTSDADSADTLSWGPGVKYFWTKRSYLELSYNFSEDDNNSDFWAGAVHINPTPRTRLLASYDKRFYGDAYEFLLSHRSRRITNSIRYTEEAVSFDRDLFSSGSTVEEISLSRRLEWSTVLKGRRTDYEFSLFHDEREALNATADEQNDEVDGIGIAVRHRLSRRFSLAGRFDYDYYQFISRTRPTQNDYYRIYELEGQYEFNKHLSSTFGVEHNNKSSSFASNSYDETRIFIDIRMQL
ncbi:hypothetical protein BIT28_23060 [Photobacterium proteolyticum]|uniref:Uncharacterized protein n=1 Tax=Photobacterium proteolyticum TaxID=1903952 RepID=A0A1Q9GLT6_9GAMM|nr:TIGR03016 family PEP-CTERM system-associated outer membrane protein [Photobacterium proteolyticum]OLQ75513.1 hypothetical protein BIT28_23060 [Photobacterium proteolyticum]